VTRALTGDHHPAWSALCGLRWRPTDDEVAIMSHHVVVMCLRSTFRVERLRVERLRVEGIVGAVPVSPIATQAGGAAVG